MIHIIVEPHADDAYLSLHTHIKSWISSGDKVKIVTVFSATRKRSVDAHNYACSVGADWVGLRRDEGTCRDGDDVLDLDLAIPMNFGDAEPVQFYLPLGLQNPDHKDVRIAADREIESPIYYAEIPYYTKKKNKEEFLAAVEGMQIHSVEALPGMKAREKYWKCFKDQSKFFYFNKPEDMARIAEFTFIRV